MDFFDIVTVLAVLLGVLYWYMTSNYDFWKNRGVVGPKPSFPFGNLKDVMFAKRSLNDLVTEDYYKFDAPMWGVFARGTPVVVLKDPEYIKDVLIKDFTVFSDRGLKVHERVEPLAQHLFSLEPKRWRPLRTKLSPVFTSGKLKEMFYLLVDCADHFTHFLNQQVEKNPVVECRELSAKFTTDVIGTCAFGLEMNALADEESEFRKMGRLIFDTSGWRLWRLKIKQSLPWLYELLKPIMYDYELNDFFINMMTQTIDYRKKNGVKRNDFVDLLIDIKDNPSKVGDIEMTNELITAQAFVFFAAGFETSSTTISNALYELALNKSIQNKLREEIKSELAKNDGKLTYEGIKGMKYLTKVFSETLRMYPPVPVLMRKSMAPYTFSGTKVSIPEDTPIWIPAFAIQRDPKIYPDPDTFDPERFDDENVKTRHPSFYLPFGDGPRNCIGARFAHYQSKVGIIKFIQDFEVDTCDQTTIPYEFNQKAFLLAPVDGIKLKLTKIK